MGCRPGCLAVAGLSSLKDRSKVHKLFTSARARQENGVSGGGLITAVHPAARAAPSLRVIMADGKFQGVMIELIPTIIQP